MKKKLLITTCFFPALAFAADTIPPVVQQFGEQQGISIIKEIDAPAA